MVRASNEVLARLRERHDASPSNNYAIPLYDTDVEHYATPSYDKPLESSRYRSPDIIYSVPGDFGEEYVILGAAGGGSSSWEEGYEGRESCAESEVRSDDESMSSAASEAPSDEVRQMQRRLSMLGALQAETIKLERVSSRGLEP